MSKNINPPVLLQGRSHAFAARYAEINKEIDRITRRMATETDHANAAKLVLRAAVLNASIYNSQDRVVEQLRSLSQELGA